MVIENHIQVITKIKKRLNYNKNFQMQLKNLLQQLNEIETLLHPMMMMEIYEIDKKDLLKHLLELLYLNKRKMQNQFSIIIQDLIKEMMEFLQLQQIQLPAQIQSTIMKKIKDKA